MNQDEEKLYLAAETEFEGNNRHHGTYLKAMAAADGDSERAKFIYIKIRVATFQSALKSPNAPNMAEDRWAAFVRRYPDAGGIDEDSLNLMSTLFESDLLFQSVMDEGALEQLGWPAKIKKAHLVGAIGVVITLMFAQKQDDEEILNVAITWRDGCSNIDAFFAYKIWVREIGRDICALELIKLGFKKLPNEFFERKNSKYTAQQFLSELKAASDSHLKTTGLAIRELDERELDDFGNPDLSGLVVGFGCLCDENVGFLGESDPNKFEPHAVNEIRKIVDKFASFDDCVALCEYFYCEDRLPTSAGEEPYQNMQLAHFWALRAVNKFLVWLKNDGAYEYLVLLGTALTD